METHDFKRNILKSMRLEHLAVFSIIVIGFVFYLWILTRHPLIYGIDGPYYLIQVRSLLESGQLAHGDPPLSLLLFTFFTLLVGGDMTLGVRVGVAFFSALSTVPLYFLIRKITQKEYAGYVAMLACIFSAPHIRMMNDLLKNAVGVCFLFFFFYYLHNMVFCDGGRKNMIFASLFLVLTGATHVLDFGVALLFFSLYLATVLVFNVHRRQFVKAVGFISLILGFFTAVAFVIFPSLFTSFFKGFYFLQDLFSASEQGAPIFFLFDPRGGGMTLFVLTVGVILAVHEWRIKENMEAVLVLTVATIVGWLLCLPFIPSEWLWRFLLMEFIPVAVILGYSSSKMERKMALAIFLILVIFPLILQSVEASKNMGPTINEKGYHELVMMSDHIIQSNSVIVINPQIGYWIQYVTRCDVARTPSQESWQSYEHILALIKKIPGQPYLTPHGAKLPPLFDGEMFVLFELQY